jgi:hypothetical protein
LTIEHRSGWNEKGFTSNHAKLLVDTSAASGFDRSS